MWVDVGVSDGRLHLLVAFPVLFHTVRCIGPDVCAHEDVGTSPVGVFVDISVVVVVAVVGPVEYVAPVSWAVVAVVVQLPWTVDIAAHDDDDDDDVVVDEEEQAKERFHAEKPPLAVVALNRPWTDDRGDIVLTVQSRLLQEGSKLVRASGQETGSVAEDLHIPNVASGAALVLHRGQ